MNKKSQAGFGLSLILLVIVGFMVFILAANIFKMIDREEIQNFTSTKVIGQDENISINYSNPDLIKGDSREVLEERIVKNKDIING
jgi:hypothetical protein